MMNGDCSLASLARLVHKDYPPLAITELHQWLLRDGAKRRDLLPRVAYQRFGDQMVMEAALCGYTPHVVTPTAFATKWFNGRARPEEALQAWSDGQLYSPLWATEELDRQLHKTRAELRRHPESFTAYPEGCPNHPSYPAMHGAAAGMAIVFAILFDLTDYQLDVVRRVAANIALGRDFAGVHYRTDSLAGLDIGEQVVARWLPVKLEELGASRVEVEAIAQQALTHWLKNG